MGPAPEGECRDKKTETETETETEKGREGICLCATAPELVARRWMDGGWQIKRAIESCSMGSGVEMPHPPFQEQAFVVDGIQQILQV